MKNQRGQYLTKPVIEGLFSSLYERNLLKIPKAELISRLDDSKARGFVKSKKEGIETCYHGYFNGAEVIACTTHSDYLGDLKKRDIGWVLLVSRNSTEPLFSFPIRRTKNYCTTMLAWVDCFIEIAEKWPLFPKTTIPLRLIRVSSKMHMRKFVPAKGSDWYPRRKPYYFWIIEMDLSVKNSKFLIHKFKSFYTYRNKDDQKRLEAGETPRSFARVIRYDKKHPPDIKGKGLQYDSTAYNDGDHLP